MGRRKRVDVCALILDSSSLLKSKSLQKVGTIKKANYALVVKTSQLRGCNEFPTLEFTKQLAAARRWHSP